MAERKTEPSLTAAVVGAGRIGAGIAQRIATAGLRVDLLDLDADKVERGIELIRADLAAAVERGTVTASQAERMLGSIDASRGWDRLAEAQLVIETVFENLDIKREVFRKLERACGAQAVLATHTSSFRVEQIAEVLADPSRAIGLHHFHHPARNRLVEIVTTDSTSVDARELVWAFEQRIGGTTIDSTDSPGFVVNRFFVPWMIEAVRLLDDDGIGIATIETLAERLFGAGRGPFASMNALGVATALDLAEMLGEAFGPFYRPPAALARQADEQRPWPLDGVPDSKCFDAVERRLLGALFLAVGQLVDERVATKEDADIGARVGLRWRRGPFQLANEIGVDRAAELVRPLAARWQLGLPEVWSARATSGVPFDFRRVRGSLRDRVATLTIHRPDSLNALDDHVIAQLTDAFHEAASNPDVGGIVVAGSGEGFVVGSDIKFFLRHLERRDLDRIIEFARSAHVLLNAIEHCHKPVVARVHGPALGSGLEIALACHRIVATPQGRFGFPETGLGIFPGLGGSQRTSRRVGIGMTKALIFTGEVLTADEAVAIGLIDVVVPHTELDGAIRRLIAAGGAPNDSRSFDRDNAALAKFFEHHSVEDLRTGRVDTRGLGVLERAVEQVGKKAPLALRVAERLIDDGFDRPLHEAMHLELEQWSEILASRDAYEGLSAFGSRAPHFEGH